MKKWNQTFLFTHLTWIFLCIPGRCRRKTDRRNSSSNTERRPLAAWPRPVHRCCWWWFGPRHRRELGLRVGSRPRPWRRGRARIRWRAQRTPRWRRLWIHHRWQWRDRTHHYRNSHCAREIGARRHRHPRTDGASCRKQSEHPAPITNRSQEYRCAHSWVVAEACQFLFCVVLFFVFVREVFTWRRT